MLIAVCIYGMSPDLFAIVVSIENDITPVIFAVRIMDSVSLR